MTVAEYKTFSDLFDDGILTAVLPQSAIARRKTIGGCAPDELKRQISVLRAAVEKTK